MLTVCHRHFAQQNFQFFFDQAVKCAYLLRIGERLSKTNGFVEHAVRRAIEYIKWAVNRVCSCIHGVFLRVGVNLRRSNGVIAVSET